MGSGLGGKKCAKRELLTFSGEFASSRLRNVSVTVQTASFLAVQIVRGVASFRKGFQCWALAAFLALKYPALDSRAVKMS